MVAPHHRLRRGKLEGRRLHGGAPHAEHLARTTTTTPDGTVSVGAGQVEFFLDPPYLPYGLTAR